MTASVVVQQLQRREDRCSLAKYDKILLEITRNFRTDTNVYSVCFFSARERTRLKNAKRNIWTKEGSECGKEKHMELCKK